MSTLEQWADNGWLKRYGTSPTEVNNLLAIVERELRDSAIGGLSLDARLGMLYNAALKLADVALRKRGYRAGSERSHYRVITSIPHTLGAKWKEVTAFLVTIQKLRHRSDYESVGLATEAQVELRHTVTRMQAAIGRLINRPS